MDNKNKSTFWELLKFAVIALLIVIPIRMFITQPFLVSGESMDPTFANKQYLMVDELTYNLGKIHRGDVVIFRYPLEPKRFFIKRIIGLPNEEIQIKNGEVKIVNAENPNGIVLSEPYINEKFSTTGTYKTEADEYFVMGDNRNRSSDSRVWGVVPKKNLMGRAYLRLFPISKISYLPGEYSY